MMRFLRQFLPLLVSLALLGLVFTRIDFSQMAGVIAKIDLVSLGIAVLLIAAYFASGALRFTWLLERFDNISFRDLVALNFVAILSAHVVGILSEGLRITYLTKFKNMSLADSIASNIADRLLSVWFLCLFLFLSLPFILPTTVVISLSLFSLTMLTLSVFALRFNFWPAFLKRIIAFLTVAFSPPAHFLKQFLCAFAGTFFVAIALWVIAHALSMALTLPQALWLAPVALLASIVPFTYAGLGTREAALAFCLPLTGIATPESAIALSLILGACYFFASLPAVLMWPAMTGFSMIKQKPENTVT